MDLDVLRDRFKSGALSGVYGVLRRAKRTMRGEPLAGDLPVQPSLITLPELQQMAARKPRAARVYYSQAHAWLEQGAMHSAARALACLRCALYFGFESPERVALLSAVCAARSGLGGRARELCAALDVHDLTSEEVALREGLLGATDSPSRTEPTSVLQARVEELSPRSLLVVEDDAAETASWAAQAQYLLVSPVVNGLSLGDLRGLSLRFDVGVGSLAARMLAEQTGIVCEHWVARE